MADDATGPGTLTKGTGSLRKGLNLLSSMADAEQTGLRLNEIVSRTGLDPATAHRLLGCLVGEGFLEKQADKRYRLGPRIFELGLAAGQIYTECAHAHQPLRALAQSLHVTAVLSRRSGAETVYVDRVTGPEALPGLRAALGTRLPIGIGAGGVAILAAMPSDQAASLINGNAAVYRRFNRAAPRLLRRRIDAAKASGFALTESFLRPGIWAVGVVVPEEDRAPRFAVSVVLGECQTLDGSEMVPALRQAASEVSSAIATARAITSAVSPTY